MNSLDNLATCRFRPNTFQLHVRDGDVSNGNSGCDPPEALESLTMYRVKIQLQDKRVAVYVNDEQVCTEVAKIVRCTRTPSCMPQTRACVKGFLFEDVYVCTRLRRKGMPVLFRWRKSLVAMGEQICCQKPDRISHLQRTKSM